MMMSLGCIRMAPPFAVSLEVSGVGRTGLTHIQYRYVIPPPPSFLLRDWAVVITVTVHSKFLSHVDMDFQHGGVMGPVSVSMTDRPSGRQTILTMVRHPVGQSVIMRIETGPWMQEWSGGFSFGFSIAYRLFGNSQGYIE